jgi:serine protease
VYLVFWGSQWGSQSTGTHGYTNLTGDPSGAAPTLQALFAGLGTAGETWSGTVTQYCSGAAPGATACPPTAVHVGYPAGGALAGVWVDDSAAAPAQATAAQIAAEAVAAAAHFGNTTAASNRTAQYLVVSPPGTQPDGFGTPAGAFCAWHDDTSDPMLAGGADLSRYGPVAFANLPYLTDGGAACGENFVNSGSAGTDDGFTLMAGAMYSEMVTDHVPQLGWTDSNGNEVANKCAWIASGPGSAEAINLSTGTFALPATWSNDLGSGGGCEVSHAVITSPGAGAGAVTIATPEAQVGIVGASVSLPIQAAGSTEGEQLTYAATGLPPGLTIDPSTGTISGTLRIAGTYTATVRATDAANDSSTASFTWTVNRATSGGCQAAQLLGDADFEDGTAGPWSATPGVLHLPLGPARAGSWEAWLGGYGYDHTDTLSQVVTLPAGCATYSLSFALQIATAESDATPEGTLQVQVLDTAGNQLATLGSYTNLDASARDTRLSFSLAAFAGQQVEIQLTDTESPGDPTMFILSHFALVIAPAWIRPSAIALTDPGRQSGSVGMPANLTIHATDSNAAQTPTFSASGLPAGLSIDPNSGLISGTPTTPGTNWVSVRAADPLGASNGIWFRWRIAPGGGA